MAFQVIYNNMDCLIEVHLQGGFDWAVVEEAVPQISTLVKQTGCTRILLDFRASKVSMSTLKIYLTPEKLAEEFAKHNIDILNLKRALLLSQEDNDYHFLETVMLNNNHQFSIFIDETRAREWLLGKA